MPVYNCESTLATSIKSILNQTCSDWELIIFDDGSKDHTAEIARSFKDSRIRIYSETSNKGLAARLNDTISLSAGKYYARMDGDDVAYPERLELQIKYLDDNPQVDMVACRVVVFDSLGMPIGSLNASQTHDDICRRPWSGFMSLMHPTFAGRAEWFRAHKFRSKFRKAQDRDLLFRSYKKSRFACLPNILLGYRQETLDLKKILLTRYYVCIGLRDEAFSGYDLKLLVGVLEQVAKGCVDTIAVTTGLNYRILKHRALRLPLSEIERWQQVWAQANNGAIS